MSEHPAPGEGYWYMAGPYSDDPHNLYNHHMVSAYWLTRSRLTIYSPIVHFHLMAQKYSMPTDAAFWIENDYNMILRSNGMIILQLPNWRESKGVALEVAYCQLRGKHVWGLKPPEKLEFEWTRLF